jgi:hypothetical protein
MIFLRARWYDGYLNRFISPDTIIPDFTNPQSLNRYTYVLNNPVRYRDPSGHWIEIDEGLGIREAPDDTYRVLYGGTRY